MKNKYIYHTKISEAKFREIVKLFYHDLNATTVVKLTGVSRNSVNILFNKFRIIIAEICQLESPIQFEKKSLKSMKTTSSSLVLNGKIG